MFEYGITLCVYLDDSVLALGVIDPKEPAHIDLPLDIQSVNVAFVSCLVSLGGIT